MVIPVTATRLPELNPVERIFEYLRGAVEGKVYGTLEAKMNAVERELQRLAACPHQVKSLAGWEWIGAALEKFKKSFYAKHGHWYYFTPSMNTAFNFTAPERNALSSL